MLLIDREMPKSCGDCVCNNDNFLCNITYDEFDGNMWERRMPNCPLKEEELKTGKWINAYPDIEPNPMLMYGICSVCGFEQSISDKLKYCPNCGARMAQEGEL